MNGLEVGSVHKALEDTRIPFDDTYLLELRSFPRAKDGVTTILNALQTPKDIKVDLRDKDGNPLDINRLKDDFESLQRSSSADVSQVAGRS